MSQANVDRFIETINAFNGFAEAPEAFDPRALEEFLAVMDPEVQFEPQQTALEGGYVGREGVMQWLTDLAQHYKGGHMRCPDIRDLGDRLLALGTLRVVGRGSGIEAEVPVALLATFRDGLITHFKDYGDRESALQAAGLPQTSGT
jgi:ketosteroid isomerase-like protein